MHARNTKNLVFDFGLKGHETQETFNVEKYRALVGGNPQGLTLQVLVEEHWSEWVEHVARAPWLRNWQKSGLYTPGPNARYDKLARVIYVEAVWGFGYIDWLTGEHATLKNKKGHGPTNAAARTIFSLQKLKTPGAYRTYLWDDRIYRGCGMLIPCEFGELDRWLEGLWLEACYRGQF